MYKLYTSSGACSLAVHALLNETGVDFEPIVISTSTDAKTPEYLKLNPRGQVPLLILEDGTALPEGAAQMIHLLDTHTDGKLLPKGGKDRTTALQWLMFANSSLHPAYSKWFWTKGAEMPAQYSQQAAEGIQKMWDQIENRLAETGGYLNGSQPTAADFFITVFAIWGSGGSAVGEGGLKFGPKTVALLKNMTARPSFVKAMQTENVTYKAAA